MYLSLSLSPPLFISFPLPKPVEPEVIRNLNVSEITASSVYMSWSEPEGNRSFFTIQYTDGNVSKTHRVSETSFNVTGLTPGVRYTFGVAAVAGYNEVFGKAVETTHCTRKMRFMELTCKSVWTFESLNLCSVLK